MNRRYLKLAGTVVSGSAALLMLSGCWSRSPRAPDQAYNTTTTTYSHQGAPVYYSDAQWQRGYAPARTVNESAGAQPQQQQTQQQSQQYAPVDSSNSQWQSSDQRLASPRATEPTTTTTSPCATSQSRPMAYTTPAPTGSMVTEGPNSGGRWRPGLREQTKVPTAGYSEGWLIGYYNPNYEAPKVVVREAAGSSSHNSQQWNERQQQQIDQQQREINQQRQQINQQRQQINQLQQQMNQHHQRMNQQEAEPAPSSNSTKP